MLQNARLTANLKDLQASNRKAFPPYVINLELVKKLSRREVFEGKEAIKMGLKA